MCYSPYIWYCKGGSFQNFTFILTWKMNKKIDNYKKKLKTNNVSYKIWGHNSQYLYKWWAIYHVYSSFKLHIATHVMIVGGYSG